MSVQLSVQMAEQLAEQMMEQKEIISRLKKEFGDMVIENHPFPKAYFEDLNKVKAIYLGCDPSNKHCHDLKHAFAIESDCDKFKGFVTQHKNNLKEVGLSLNQVYVQNLCQNYFAKETSKNLKVWKAAAKEFWIEHLKNELDELFDSNIPVLLTSQYLLEVLGDTKWSKIQAPDFYQCNVEIPIPANQNKLGRPLIPMYRGRNPNTKISYLFKNNHVWNKYKSRIKEILKI